MGDRKPETMAEAIGEHIRRQGVSDRILERLVESDRAVNDVYKEIRDVLGRPEMKNRAVVDEASNRVYVLHGDTMHDYEMVRADAVEMRIAFLHDCDTIISVGEAS